MDPKAFLHCLWGLYWLYARASLLISLRSIGSKYKTAFWKGKGLPFDREQQLIIDRLDTLQKQ